MCSRAVPAINRRIYSRFTRIALYTQQRSDEEERDACKQERAWVMCREYMYMYVYVYIYTLCATLHRVIFVGRLMCAALFRSFIYHLGCRQVFSEVFFSSTTILSTGVNCSL